MKNCYLIVLCSLIFFCEMNDLQAQRPPGKRGQGRPSIKAIIKGKISDAESGKPLEFATFTLFGKRDSTIVSGGITDGNGMFNIETRPGRFFAKIEFISYESKIIDNIKLGRDKLSLDLGDISIKMDASTLSEVEVRAEKSQVQMSLDKRVFNVGKDLASKGGTAADILDNVPSVTVDIDGGVELRGSGNVRILVDGKPSGMLGADNANSLRQFPANLIDRVEVITNPSARYEAEGMAGIINIILRKEKKSGLNGSFDFNVGYPLQYGVGINLNYRRKNFNFFTNLSTNKRKNIGGGFNFQRRNLEDGNTLFSDQDRSSDRESWANSIRFGADYIFNKHNTLTAAFLYKIADEDNFGTIDYFDYYNTPSSIKERIRRTDDEIEKENKLEYSLQYNKTFTKKGQKFSAEINYQDNTEEEGSDLLEVTSFPAGAANLNQRSDNKEGENRLSFQVDYVHPFSKESKFEIGARSSLREINNDFDVKEEGLDGWKSLPGLTNIFEYDENIHAAYAIYGNKKGKFSYQIGVRGEYSDVTTTLVTTDSVNARSYINAFPSAHISYDLPKNNAIQLSYSRRIKRPRFWDLNPFFTFSDARNFFSGNPNLDPEFTNSYEISHIKYFENGSISSAIYYRHTTDVIRRVLTVFQDGTTFRQPENLDSQKDLGLEFTFSLNPVKWLRVNGSFNAFRNIVDGGEIGSSDSYTSNGRLSTKMTILKNTDFQISGNYRGPRDTPQGRRLTMYTIDLGLSRDILKKKGTLTLSARDLFNSRKRRGIFEEEDFYQKSEFQWRGRQIVLNLNYRLNQKKKRGRSSNRGAGSGGEF